MDRVCFWHTLPIAEALVSYLASILLCIRLSARQGALGSFLTLSSRATSKGRVMGFI